MKMCGFCAVGCGWAGFGWAVAVKRAVRVKVSGVAGVPEYVSSKTIAAASPGLRVRLGFSGLR